ERADGEARPLPSRAAQRRGADPRRGRGRTLDRALDAARRRGLLLVARTGLLAVAGDPPLRRGDRGHTARRACCHDRHRALLARLATGTTLGAVAGWFSGRAADRLVSALIDAFAAFPTILFALLWIFAFDIRSGLSAFVLALAITGWWGFGRATRSAVVALQGRPFLEAGRALGLSEFALFTRHVLPNLMPILAVSGALEASAILLALCELGFLGIVVGG